MFVPYPTRPLITGIRAYMTRSVVSTIVCSPRPAGVMGRDKDAFSSQWPVLARLYFLTLKSTGLIETQNVFESNAKAACVVVLCYCLIQYRRCLVYYNMVQRAALSSLKIRKDFLRETIQPKASIFFLTFTSTCPKPPSCRLFF